MERGRCDNEGRDRRRGRETMRGATDNFSIVGERERERDKERERETNRVREYSISLSFY